MQILFELGLVCANIVPTLLIICTDILKKKCQSYNLFEEAQRNARQRDREWNICLQLLGSDGQ